MTRQASRCRVLALTADGTVDETFGDHGYAGLASTSDAITCDAMIESPDGGLLVSGADGLKPVLIKLIASGAPDPAFAVDALANTSMIKAATVDIDANTGAIAVAGYGPSDIAGFPVVRLHSNGSLDPLFGSGGETWVDLPPGRPHPFVSDLIVLPNSDVLIAGGSHQGIYFNAAFVTRLVGGDDKDSPGVIGVLNTVIEASEDGQQAIVTVRRVGGKTGSVSVAYATRATSSDAFHATEGDDFTALTDRLTWADGDAADKQFSVPIGADDGAPEEREDFDVELSDVQGGAGLGHLDHDREHRLRRNRCRHVRDRIRRSPGERRGPYCSGLHQPELLVERRGHGHRDTRFRYGNRRRRFRRRPVDRVMGRR